MRTAIALTVLFAFWGMTAYTFWPDLLSFGLQLVQSVRGMGAQQIESDYLAVRNNSTASEAEVRAVVERLEADYAALLAFLDQQPDRRIPVLITNGSGPALTDGVRLNLFYDRGQIDQSTAPFFVVLLSEGDLSLSGTNLFIEGGFAVYVVEACGLSQDLLGQSTDAWVTWLGEQDALLPLSDAWTVGLPEGEQGMFRFVRALLQGGSFIRWLAESYGLETVQDLRGGLSLEEATDQSLLEAEHRWLESVEAQSLRPLSCAQVVPERSALRWYCPQLDGMER